MKVEVAVLGSPSLLSLICTRKSILNEVAVQSSGEISGEITLTLTHTQSSGEICVKVEMAVLGSPSLISLICGRKTTLNEVAVQNSGVV